MDNETGYEDDVPLTERCRQCGDTVAVEDEPRSDGPFICPSCISRTVNRATRSPLSQHVFETGVLLARIRRAG